MKHIRQLEFTLSEKLLERPKFQAIGRGFRRKCPNCNEGALFQGYLKVQDYCPSCGEAFYHQRADDGPAWATMLITGHMIPPVIMGVYDNILNPNPLIVAIILITFFAAITLILLPRIKGVFIAIQWANYMYGFDPKFKDNQIPDPSMNS